MILKLNREYTKIKAVTIALVAKVNRSSSAALSDQFSYLMPKYSSNVSAFWNLISMTLWVYITAPKMQPHVKYVLCMNNNIGRSPL